MKRALALDLDDIIYPFMQTLVPLHNEKSQSSFSIEDYFTFEFSRVWGGTEQEAATRVNEYFKVIHAMTNYPAPMTGAELAIKALAEEYRLFIVTSRFDELREGTHAWIDAHFPDTFEDIFLCNSYMVDGRTSKRTKGSVVEMLDAVGLVDDSATHIIEVANQGRTGILFGDYPWSRGRDLPETVVRASDWPEVTKVLLS